MIGVLGVFAVATVFAAVSRPLPTLGLPRIRLVVEIDREDRRCLGWHRGAERLATALLRPPGDALALRHRGRVDRQAALGGIRSRSRRRGVAAGTSARAGASGSRLHAAARCRRPADVGCFRGVRAGRDDGRPRRGRLCRDGRRSLVPTLPENARRPRGARSRRDGPREAVGTPRAGGPRARNRGPARPRRASGARWEQRSASVSPSRTTPGRPRASTSAWLRSCARETTASGWNEARPRDSTRSPAPRGWGPARACS